MKLNLKNGSSIDIDNVNNRQNLTVKDENGHEPDQHIIFSIFNAGPEVIFEDLLTKIKGNNTEFNLTYGEGQKIDYTGWILSDLTEEITDEQRKITLLATKIESRV